MDNKDFELVNGDIENWKDIQFVEADPYQNGHCRAKIALCVNWKAKTSTMETRYNDGSTPMREYHGINQTFTLPENVDATQFLAHYNEHIKPLLQTRGKGFEIVWDGNNHIGSFTQDDPDNSLLIEQEVEIEESTEDSPEHDKGVYFSIGESFQNYEDIIDVLSGGDINFITCDLNDSDVVNKIMEWLTDDCVFLGDGEYADELKDIRECILENEGNNMSECDEIDRRLSKTFCRCGSPMKKVETFGEKYHRFICGRYDPRMSDIEKDRHDTIVEKEGVNPLEVHNARLTTEKHHSIQEAVDGYIILPNPSYVVKTMFDTFEFEGIKTVSSEWDKITLETNKKTNVCFPCGCKFYTIKENNRPTITVLKQFCQKHCAEWDEL